MSLKISELPDEFQDLDWGISIYVGCGESFTVHEFTEKCCLCQKNLRSSDEENHVLIGSPESDIERIISKIHYLCKNCKRKCTICCD